MEVTNGIMLNPVETLQIEPNVLSGLRKNNVTATARSILKYKFPNPSVNFKLADIDPELANAIVCEPAHFYFHFPFHFPNLFIYAFVV
ncbi:unnamed protein product [Adineta steineri]|uniref:Uncharacterized protein n=1 Tax=Adineta steineri TaxID=433720 RepID=A0A815KHM8_9BILA|nr:unnamed protein product [Adineta steineri]CAF1396561.1 unnamed protein product [Adineta steineri]CAF3746722.1 unnamed protein product [Adineta steineri]CAF3799344.1 unnamed protein product [Adineta steineri]